MDSIQENGEVAQEWRWVEPFELIGNNRPTFGVALMNGKSRRGGFFFFLGVFIRANGN